MSIVISEQNAARIALGQENLWQRYGRRIGQALVIPALFLLLWSVAVAAAWVDPKVVPSPWAVLQTLWHSLQQGSFWQGIWASLSRNLSGYLIGASLGVGFALLIGHSKLANWLFAPSFHVLRQVSLFAWLPLLSSFLGTGNGAKILFITLSVFYPVALHSLEGVRSIAQKQREVADVYQFPTLYRYQKLILPGAAPQIFVGLQLGLIFAWLATIGSEFLLANYGTGIGNLVIRGREQFNVSLIIVGMLIIAALGIVQNQLLARVERRVLAWQQQGK
jgi:sulfonate transport system permease protein